MSKYAKALHKLRNNPRNVRFQDLKRILLSLGFQERPGSGSHAVFVHPKLFKILTIPRRRPFLAETYVKQALILIDSLESIEG